MKPFFNLYTNSKKVKNALIIVCFEMDNRCRDIEKEKTACPILCERYAISD